MTINARNQKISKCYRLYHAILIAKHVISSADLDQLLDVQDIKVLCKHRHLLSNKWWRSIHGKKRHSCDRDCMLRTVKCVLTHLFQLKSILHKQLPFLHNMLHAQLMKFHNSINRNEAVLNTTPPSGRSLTPPGNSLTSYPQHFTGTV